MTSFAFRRDIITKPIFSWARTVLPVMSDTEREALEAGDVWWDADLFTGNPDWTRLLSHAPATLTAEEQAFLNGPVDELCAMLDDWKINWEWRDLPPEVWDYIKARKFFGMIIPKEYGGLGFSPYAHSEVVRKISSRSLTAAVTVMVPNSLGPGELLMRFGTKDQQQAWLPRLADGREIPCFGLTSPEAGSDAASMIDSGIICKGHFEGREVLGLRLNWHKRYITLGPVATLLGLAFKAYDPDHLVGPRDELGITVALDPDASARGRDRPSPSAVDAGVSERSEPGPRCLYSDGLHHRRPGASRPGLENADDGVGRRARHLAAVLVGGGGRLRRTHQRRLCANSRAVQRADRKIRRHRGAAGPHRRHRLSARCGAAADLCGAQSGPSSRGDFRHHEAAGHRADADRDRRRDGHPWWQGRDRRAAELSGRPLSLGAGRHHRGGRQHSHPQPDRVRAGRDSRASLSAGRDECARRPGPRQGAGCL